MKSRNYDPRTFDEDFLIEASGILGWLARRRKKVVIGFISSIVNTPSRPYILDVGCGYGEILRDCSGVLKVGVDINRNAIKRAKEKDKESFFVISDIRCLPFKHQSFDCVVCSEVIEHFDNPQHLAEEITGVIKPGGYFCITVPNEWITTIGRFLLRKKPYKTTAHKVSFSWKRLKKIFPYDVVRLSNIPFDFLPFLISTNLVALFKK